MIKIYLTLAGFLVIGFCSQAFAQCCAAGNPSCTNNALSAGGSNTLDVSLSYMHFYSDTYYQGDKKLNDFHYISNSYFDFSSLYLAYGITNDLRITGEIGYFYTKQENFDFGFSSKANGLGDAALGLIFNLYKNQDYLFEIIPSGKFTMPVGEFYQMSGPVVMPIDIQPSSGSYKYELGLTISKKFSGSKFSLLSYNSAEISQRIENERTNYKYGNQYNFSLYGIYGITDYMTGLLQGRVLVREKASDYPGQINDYTGGVVLFVSPQLSINFLKSWRFSAQFDLPVYTYMNGIQLATKYSLLAKISRSIDFGGGEQKLPDMTFDKSMTMSEIRIEGLCEMCKTRIENTAREVRNVAAASWDAETKLLTIGYTNPVNLDDLKKAIAKAGHDTDKFKASDDVYNSLPQCCRYRDK